MALALATLILTAVGVFIDVAVITVSPIALALARRTDLSKPAILLAMIGGGKAGNLMSPNPNAIAAADTFHFPLTSVMMAGIVPAIWGLILTYFLAKRLKNKGSRVSAQEVVVVETQNLPSFLTALFYELPQRKLAFSRIFHDSLFCYFPLAFFNIFSLILLFLTLRQANFDFCPCTFPI